MDPNQEDDKQQGQETPSVLDAMREVVKIDGKGGPDDDETGGDNDQTQPPASGDANQGTDPGDQGSPAGTDQPGGDGDQPGEGDQPGQQPGQQPGRQSEKLTDADLELTDDEKKTLSQPAQSRFQKLASGVREANERADRLEQHNQQIIQTQLEPLRKMFTESRMEPEQIAEVFDYGRAMNTGDFTTAGKILLKQVREYQLATGQPLNLEGNQEASPLSEYPDLQDQVNKMQITEQAALEIAKGRRQQALQTQRQQRDQQQREAANTQQAQVQQLMADVGEWSRQMQAKDPNWPARQAKLEAKAVQLAKTVPIDQVMPRLQEYYELLVEVGGSQPLPGQQPGQQPGQRRPQPMSSGGNGSGSIPQAGSAEDAALMALGIKRT